MNAIYLLEVIICALIANQVSQQLFLPKDSIKSQCILIVIGLGDGFAELIGLGDGLAEMIGLGDGLAKVMGWGEGAGETGAGDGGTVLHISLYKQVPSS